MLKLSRLQFLVGLAAVVTLCASASTGVAAEKLKVAVLVPGLANDRADCLRFAIEPEADRHIVRHRGGWLLRRA